ncbi:hypothetical protein ATE92_2608 [Ulvibacter sp. MAR_2010_11]|uniref:hypothetical protein n=1 Tax=Ulvibacter sp. MAR_2010_11 TaxID=1250229 RepID=UPI000C2CD16D|nr:hypothetical protein [Ulvibacter sp. MAR_2010_11]PKA84419.1 hypothetical protein ATE92_2608 [Ulvibacter sp. MAR_2010_11]
MKRPLFLLCVLVFAYGFNASAQEVHIDGRLQPLLIEFFALCKSHNIEYQEKLDQLETIDIVNDLHTEDESATLGMLRRDANGTVKNIAIHWMAMLDPQILKIIAFHEFGHYFLEYNTHVCNDCGIIMSVVNSSYFDIANDWENQVKILFEQSPVFLKNNEGSNSTIAESYPLPD